MIEEHAIVLTLEADSANPSIATLEIVRQSACGLCGQTRGCGNALWGKLFAHQSASFRAENAINAKIGDHVIVGINEQALMKSALLLYLLPLVVMLLSALAFQALFTSEWAAILGAFTGLLLTFLWVKGHTAGRQYYQRHQPKILRFDVAQAIEKQIKFQ